LLKANKYTKGRVQNQYQILIRQKLLARNSLIFADYQKDEGIYELSARYFLSIPGIAPPP
jgi:hypothetical protein